MKPEMRFEGFEEEWEKKKIIDIAPLQRGFDLVKKNIVPGKYPIGYSNGILGNHNEFKVEGPGVFTGRSGTIGNVHYTNENYWPHNTSLWVTDFKGNHEKFIYYFYKNVNLKRYDAGSGVPTLNRNDVHSLSEFIPKYEEQQIIASFLTILESKIEKQQEKIEKLEELKKGMMQNVFSREIRFKDENEEKFPEWKESKLVDLGLFLKGGNLAKSDLNNQGSPCILYGELYTQYDHVINKVVSRTQRNDNVVVGMKNDVLIPSSGETAIDIACASALEVDDVLLGGDINVFRPNENVSGSFISYQINSIKKNELAVYAQGSSVVHLYNNEIKKVKVFLPTFREQQKIVEFLSGIDRKIEREVEKISSLEEQKKGFMQRMFV